MTSPLVTSRPWRLWIGASAVAALLTLCCTGSAAATQIGSSTANLHPVETGCLQQSRYTPHQLLVAYGIEP